MLQSSNWNDISGAALQALEWISYLLAEDFGPGLVCEANLLCSLVRSRNITATKDDYPEPTTNAAIIMLCCRPPL